MPKASSLNSSTETRFLQKKLKICETSLQLYNNKLQEKGLKEFICTKTLEILPIGVSF